MDFIHEPMSEKHCTGIIDIFNYYIENSFATFFEKMKYFHDGKIDSY